MFHQLGSCLAQKGLEKELRKHPEASLPNFFHPPPVRHYVARERDRAWHLGILELPTWKVWEKKRSIMILLGIFGVKTGL